MVELDLKFQYACNQPVQITSNLVISGGGNERSQDAQQISEWNHVRTPKYVRRFFGPTLAYESCGYEVFLVQKKQDWTEDLGWQVQLICVND